MYSICSYNLLLPSETKTLLFVGPRVKTELSSEMHAKPRFPGEPHFW